MLVRVAAILALVCLARPALALDACFTDSFGLWRGPVYNGPGIQTMETEFHAQPDGTLAGGYHVHDTTAFDGSLTGFKQTGNCEAEFTWKDRYGTGVVHIRFEPELGRFLGYWGLVSPNPGLVFDGYRVGEEHVS
jgi:hypothetical protein